MVSFIILQSKIAELKKDKRTHLGMLEVIEAIVDYLEDMENRR